MKGGRRKGKEIKWQGRKNSLSMVGRRGTAQTMGGKSYNTVRPLAKGKRGGGFSAGSEPGLLKKAVCHDTDGAAGTGSACSPPTKGAPARGRLRPQPGPKGEV